MTDNELVATPTVLKTSVLISCKALRQQRPLASMYVVYRLFAMLGGF